VFDVKKKIAVLKQVSLFTGLDAATLEQLASISEVRPFAAGQAIFTEGEADASLFIVISGVVKIDKQVNAEQQQTLQQLKEGEFFGEISFVRGGEHIATAQAVHDAEVLLIRRTEFDKLAARNPAVGYKIMLRMAGQMATLLRNMDEKFVELVGYIYGRSKK
jgi:CRP/FNR family cyclic AMP-dependent transcriptional regulator